MTLPIDNYGMLAQSRARDRRQGKEFSTTNVLRPDYQLGFDHSSLRLGIGPIDIVADRAGTR